MNNNQMIITYDIDFNSLDGIDFTMMFDEDGITEWMNYQEQMTDELLEIAAWYIINHNHKMYYLPYPQ